MLVKFSFLFVYLGEIFMGKEANYACNANLIVLIESFKIRTGEVAEWSNALVC